MTPSQTVSELQKIEDKLMEMFLNEKDTNISRHLNEINGKVTAKKLIIEASIESEFLQPFANFSI